MLIDDNPVSRLEYRDLSAEAISDCRLWDWSERACNNCASVVSLDAIKDFTAVSSF